MAGNEGIEEGVHRDRAPLDKRLAAIVESVAASNSFEEQEVFKF